MLHSDMYDNLLGQGMNPSLAAKLDEIHQQGLLSIDEIDDRALESLKEFSEEDALNVLEQFTKSDLSRVQNKSAFLCGVMKTYKAKMKSNESSTPAVNAKPESVAQQTTSTSANPVTTTLEADDKQGPNEDKVKQLLDRTGYTLDITSGQRKYGGPPPNWEGPVPGTGAKKFCSQIFIGKLPRDMYEDELVPLFEKFGQLYDLRIMVDPFSGLNKGFAFCTYTTKDGAQSAVKGMDKYEVRGNRKLGVCLSQANNRLFVGSIPKSKTKKDIFDEFSTKVEELSDVIVYISSEDKSKNRGFAFLEFSTHKDASLARRKLMSGKIKVFGNITPTVDWADPVYEPDEEVMSKVKVVYVRNLSPAIDESKLSELFKQYGDVEKVKKLKDYAFIHFVNREDAVRAIEELDGQELDDLNIEVSLAKPQVDKSQQRRGQSGFGSMNNRGNPDGGPMRMRGRGGSSRGGYSGGYSDYDDGYSQGGYGGYDDDSYDSYYASPGRGRGQMGRGGMRGRGGPSNPRGAPIRGRGSYGSSYGGRGSSMNSRGGTGSRGGAYGGSGYGTGGGYGGTGGGYGRTGGGYGTGEGYGNSSAYNSSPRGMHRGSTRGAMSRGGMSRGAGSMNRGMPPKRKADFGQDYNTPPKRKHEGGWNSKPIAQQPLNKSNNYYNDDYSGQEWYTDLSKPRWQ